MKVFGKKLEINNGPSCLLDVCEDLCFSTPSGEDRLLYLFSIYDLRGSRLDTRPDIASGRLLLPQTLSTGARDT